MQVSQIGTMFLNCLGMCCSKLTTNTNSSRRQFPTVIEELCHRFSLTDLRKSTDNFDENRVIGGGLFSKVYKGNLQHNGVSDYVVAIKRFNEHGCEAFKKEIEVLCQLRHPRCVYLIGFCDHQNEKILVYEYMSNGSLDKHLPGGKLSWKKRVEICIGVARGLHYLHTGAKRSIFHCILRASTILLDDSMEPKLAAFGLSVQGPRFNPKPQPKQINGDHIIGLVGYMPVEYVMDGTVTDKWDVFSFGLILLLVVCGMNYLGIVTERGFLKPIEEMIDPNIKGKIAPECWEVFVGIMVRCLEYEQNERPAIGEAEVELEHALSLQEQADFTNTNGHHILSSKTIISLEVKQYSNTEEM